MKICVINGPNLNLLGVREPQHYGNGTYDALLQKIRTHCEQKGIDVTFYQSNHEGDLVDRIQATLRDGTNGIVINPAAYTHTSVALLDALKAVSLPAVEVHISKVEEREDFRQVSFVRSACIATITGHGFDGYLEAVDILCRHIEETV